MKIILQYDAGSFDLEPRMSARNALILEHNVVARITRHGGRCANRNFDGPSAHIACFIDGVPRYTGNRNALSFKARAAQVANLPTRFSHSIIIVSRGGHATLT